MHGNKHRDTQLDNVQRVSGLETLSPKWMSLSNPFHQGSGRSVEQGSEDCKSQWRRNRERRQGLQDTTRQTQCEPPRDWQHAQSLLASRPYIFCTLYRGYSVFFFNHRNKWGQEVESQEERNDLVPSACCASENGVLTKKKSSSEHVVWHSGVLHLRQIRSQRPIPCSFPSLPTLSLCSKKGRDFWTYV